MEILESHTHQQLILSMKQIAIKFAVDVPSGLDPQTGETANICSKCDMTVTFHKMKQGIPKRKDLTGELFAEKNWNSTRS